MNTMEGRAWHALAEAGGVGPKTLWRIAEYLASRGKTASWLLQNQSEIEVMSRMSKAGIVLPIFADREHAENEKFAGRQVTVLHPHHHDFPQRVKTLNERIALPALLYVRGNIALLNQPSVAIVGSRQAGATALTTAAALAGELVGAGINIISGYAAGIDTAAHLAALRAGGTTIIVLGEGINHFKTKPELNAYLTVDNILVISQFAPAARWAAYMAMTRNKLTVALSGAVVVIVSGPERDTNGKNSGTFNAGLSALKTGIPVFVVVPDFFTVPPEGNRQLIARGGRAWDPSAGIAPILAAGISRADRNPPRMQLNLFENDED